MHLLKPATIIFVIGMIVVNSSCKHAARNLEAGPPVLKDTLLFYAMAGQSNMAGRGQIAPADTVPNSRILCLNIYNQLELAHEPLHLYQLPLAGLDCGYSFANHLLPYVDGSSRIGLIPCAVGSTSISDWLNDSIKPVRLYTNLIERCQNARHYGVLKGILWHQGEAEAGDNNYRGYALQLQKFIIKVRAGLGDQHLTFFIGKLSPFCKEPHKDEINKAIEATASAMSNVFIIPTTGLTGLPDSLHFDAAGQRELGARFARTAGPLLQ